MTTAACAATVAVTGIKMPGQNSEARLRRQALHLLFAYPAPSVSELLPVDPARPRCRTPYRRLVHMATKYIVASVAASFAFAYVCGVYVADRKVLGGTTPRTVTTSEWGRETDRKFQAWPRTAGPPVAMNPIRRQNFVVKSSSEPR